jgi:hypothetical protein
VTAPAGFLLLDLHNHSDRSFDGFNRLEDYERAHARGAFDVLAITDHNRLDGAVELAGRASFPVICGMEIDTADGELVGLFLERRIPPGLSARETAERIRAQGGLVYLQHPFYPLLRRPLSPAAREALAAGGLVDVVEGLNGGPFQARYDRLAQAWARARNLALGAGSDAHEPPCIGRCLVAVPPEAVTPETLPGLLRRGVLVDRRRNSLLQLATKTRCFCVEGASRLARGERLRARVPR